jgi:acetyl-CoA/propionyl-CoA carboxylase biotin carboxyl carrier protein
MVGDPGVHGLGPILVANRGEISVRVQRSARELGLRTVAVFAAADRGAPHATLADEAVLISSYLDSDELIGAARVTGARSIHPGYGFLSENADFARAVDRAGITWIGPPPAAIELMGDKARSKRLALESGVPVVPGTDGADASAEQIRAFGTEHGYPLMIKALAGGGGKGMRVVAAAEALDAALAAARREAEAAFGDRRVLAERYLERPRHIEVQVLADSHGNALHLGERECSLQRRHQKVIEEAPSPVVDASVREEMGSAAVALAIACDYEGAGTVEFIVPASGEGFFFLEMNTRLQVEHPVTEMVWGVDLVREQLRLAAGEPLAEGLATSGPRGHAVEARLYAEDPAAGFLPSTGVIRRWREPVGAGIRIDSGVSEGSVVGTDFDPMLAKLVAHGPDRPTALARLERALAELELLGVSSSAAFTRALLADPEVSAGRLDTTLLERLLEELDLTVPDDLIAAGALGLYLADTEGLGIGAGPWRRRFDRVGEIRIGGGAISGAVRFARAEARQLRDGSLLCELDGLARTYAATLDGGTIWVARDGYQLQMAPERKTRAAPVAAGSLEAPMPGVVLIVEVVNGDRVERGQVLLVLESMKMELQVTAPVAGVVEGLELSVGDRVAQGEALAVIGADREEGLSGEAGEGAGE